MPELFDPTAMPEAPTLPTVVPVVDVPKKRKSYYVPVAKKNAEADRSAVARAHDRKAAKKADKAAKKSLKAGLGIVVPKKTTKTTTKTTIKDKPARASKPASDEAVCTICHKPLSKHTSVAQGMGDTCAMKIKLLPAGTTMEDHYEKLTVGDVPVGYIKLKDAIAKLNEKGITTHRIVQAIGGDRMLRKPLNNNFKVIFVGRVRYINGACLKNWRDLEKV